MTIPGTDTLFEIVEVDEPYQRMQYKVKIIHSDKEVMYNRNHLRYTSGMCLWIFNHRALTDFTNENPGVYQLTADILERVAQVSENVDPADTEDFTSGDNHREPFTVGDIVTMPGVNAKFEIVAYDSCDTFQPYRIKIIETDKPVRYGPGSNRYEIGEGMWARAKPQSHPSEYYIPASDLFVRVEAFPLPNIQKIRRITELNGVSTERLRAIGEEITNAANRGNSHCDVAGLNEVTAEKLLDAGYIVDGNRISW